jgi:hypothetical protein
MYHQVWGACLISVKQPAGTDGAADQNSASSGCPGVNVGEGQEPIQSYRNFQMVSAGSLARPEKVGESTQVDS